jgi:hypothetical protein
MRSKLIATMAVVVLIALSGAGTIISIQSLAA